MCLMLYKPAHAQVSRRQILNAYSHNNDGFGLMFAQAGRVHVIQDLFSGPEIVALYEQHKDKPLAMHFRYGTAGDVSKQNTHPFKVLDRDEDGFDLYMMHNGVMQGVQDIPENRSDTFQFVIEYLKPILKGNPALIHSKAFHHFMSRFLGMGNKLLFLLGDGRIYVINHFLGFTTKSGIWFSNSYSLYALRAPHRKGARIGTVVPKDKIKEIQYDQRSGMWVHEKSEAEADYFPRWLVEEQLLSVRHDLLLEKTDSDN